MDNESKQLVLEAILKTARALEAPDDDIEVWTAGVEAAARECAALAEKLSLH